MPAANTCILVAGESAAAVYDSCEGTSHFRHVTRWPCSLQDASDEARRSFAQRLVSDFYRDVQQNLYDGIIILAAPRMLAAVQGWLSPELRRLVIAEIACPQPMSGEFRMDGLSAPLPQGVLH